MCASVMTMVLERSKSKGTARLALFLMADNGGEYGCPMDHILPAVAKNCNCSMEELDKHLDKLVKMGELRRFHPDDPKPPYIDTYQITLPR